MDRFSLLPLIAVLWPLALAAQSPPQPSFVEPCQRGGFPREVCECVRDALDDKRQLDAASTTLDPNVLLQYTTACMTRTGAVTSTPPSTSAAPGGEMHPRATDLNWGPHCIAYFDAIDAACHARTPQHVAAMCEGLRKGAAALEQAVIDARAKGVDIAPHMEAGCRSGHDAVTRITGVVKD